MLHIRMALTGLAVALLSACMANDFERGVVGAAGGAVIADTIGFDPLTGVIVGGAAGAFCDELTQVCR